MNSVDTFAVLAQNGDRKAFDQLQKLAFSGTISEGVHRVAAATIAHVTSDALRTMPSFPQPETPDELLQILRESLSPTQRLMAIANYPIDDSRILPALVQIISKDDNIEVVIAALHSFGIRTGLVIPYWQCCTSLTDWWKQNGGKYLKQ